MKIILLCMLLVCQITLLSNRAYAAKEKIAMICGHLIDGKSKGPMSKRLILIEGNRITSVSELKEVPKDARVIDLSDFYVMPGMIDAHVHVTYKLGVPNSSFTKESSAKKTLRGLHTAQKMLEAGWTSLRVAGETDVHYGIFEIRDAIDSGLFQGPRIFGAGHYISVTGGGGDANDITSEQTVIPDGLIANGPDEMRYAVRNEVKYGSTWIKVLVTGAFMSSGDNPQDIHLSQAELDALFSEAKMRQVPVMAHAHSAKGIIKSIHAGARSIEHGTFIDDAGIKLMKEKGTYLIPTLAVRYYYSQKANHGSKGLEKIERLLAKYGNIADRKIRKAIREGVKIGVGSDYVGWEPTFSAKEFELLTEVGMSPMEAIKAGTIVNAELLGMDDQLGSLEKGKMADIIAVRKNPIEDMSELRRVRFVMKDGVVIKWEK